MGIKKRPRMAEAVCDSEGQGGHTPSENIGEQNTELLKRFGFKLY